MTHPTTLVARLAMGTGLLFAALLALLHALEPEFDPSWRFISEYMLGSWGWLMHLAFLCLAASQFLCLVTLFRYARSWYGALGLIVLGVAGVGIALAALFRTDPVTTGYDALSFSGGLHALGASLDYTPVAAILLSLAVVRHDAWKSRRAPLFAAAVFSFLCMVAFILFLPFDGKIGPGVWAGLAGRILVLSYVVWISVVVWPLTKAEHPGVH